MTDAIDLGREPGPDLSQSEGARETWRESSE